MLKTCQKQHYFKIRVCEIRQPTPYQKDYFLISLLSGYAIDLFIFSDTHDRGARTDRKNFPFGEHRQKEPKVQNEPSVKQRGQNVPSAKVDGGKNFPQPNTADLIERTKCPIGKKCQVFKMATCKSGGGQNVPRQKWMVIKMIPNQKVAGGNNYHHQTTKGYTQGKAYSNNYFI